MVFLDLEKIKIKIENIYNFLKNNSLFKNSIILLTVFILFIVFFYFIFFTAPKNFPNQIIINIKKGETLRKISSELKSKDIIRSKVLFEAFIVMYNGEKKISDGDYFFEYGLPVFEIARRISKKDRHLAPLKITIPEGFDVSQIANVFSLKLKNFNKEKFLLDAKDRNGYLFPDTYIFITTDDEEDVLLSMSQNFEKKIEPLKQDILYSGKTMNQIIIMASIIEREAKGDNDRGIISGILWNRILKKIPLQVDVAPDTYKTRGLPKYPISNPGLKSIEASIYPVKSNYLYYIHDKSGLIHYSRTFTEHKQNVLKYLK